LDLGHRSVGFSDLGSQPHIFLSYLLVRHGMSPSDVIPVGTGPQQAAIAALERGRLDAWAGMEPGVTMVLKRHANVRVLADTRTHEGVREIFGVDTYPGSVLYAKRDWLRQNSENARRLAKAIQASLQWIHGHSVDDIMSVVPPDHLTHDRSVYREAVLQLRDMFSEDGKMPEEGPDTVRTVLAASLDSVRKAHLDLDSTYTNEFVTGK
jgi:NitT/TauT family transport system substrate-binding protein